MYRTPAVRDEAPPKERVDHIVVERGRPLRLRFILGAIALASIVGYELPALRLALLLASLGAFVVVVVLGRQVDGVTVAIDRSAKTIAWGDVAIPFAEIAYPLFEWSTKELVLVKKHGDEPVLIARGLPDSCDRARTQIVRALMAEYESFRDMPPTLAALARQVDGARSAKEKEGSLQAVLRGLPLDDLSITEQAGVISARGKRDGVDVVVRYLRSKQRAEVTVQRRVEAAGHIELLRGSFNTNQSGLVELARRIFVNGTANSVSFGQRATSARVLRDMDRLDLRHVYLWPAEVKIVPYDTFLELRDPDIRVAEWIALAVACAEDAA